MIDQVRPPLLLSQDSPAAQWYQQWQPTPDELDIWIERAADYDGLAGTEGWQLWMGGEVRAPGRGADVPSSPCTTHPAGLMSRQANATPAPSSPAALSGGARSLTVPCQPPQSTVAACHRCSGVGDRQPEGEYRGVR